MKDSSKVEEEVSKMYQQEPLLHKMLFQKITISLWYPNLLEKDQQFQIIIK
jgi:hypothetical protein